MQISCCVGEVIDADDEVMATRGAKKLERVRAILLRSYSSSNRNILGLIDSFNPPVSGLFTLSIRDAFSPTRFFRRLRVRKTIIRWTKRLRRRMGGGVGIGMLAGGM